MTWLSGLDPQPPRGTLPASDLLPGDVVDLGHGYPADLLKVIRRPVSHTVRLIYGAGDDDWVIVSETTMLDVTGWLGARQHV